MKKRVLFGAGALLALLVVAGILGREWYQDGSIVPAIMPKPTPTLEPGPPKTPIPTHGFTTHTFVNEKNQKLTYYLYVPQNYDKTKRYPLVLLLHGVGERKRQHFTPIQNQNQILGQSFVYFWGTPDEKDKPSVQEQWPCFVVVPQLEPSQTWVQVDAHKGSYTQPAQPSTSLLLAKQLLDRLQQDYSGIDANRLYITGISLGATGTWDAIARWPDYFAAAAPVSGAGDPSTVERFRDVPVWAFHGANDTTIPASASTLMIQALQQAGGEGHVTIFPNRKHPIWGDVYTLEPAKEAEGFFPWLFAQRRNA
uniref:Uncharacterized protein n=1 Tax=Thermosporothrix sp. COM3 TaxID=2490863 RepID=A0A455SDX0_9CHLR|nr:hypothetical protein KTC_02890 [Thermosporothrix sp. COM3]